MKDTRIGNIKQANEKDLENTETLQTNKELVRFTFGDQ